MITLQNIIFPEPAICTEHPLYFHTSGPAGFSQSEGTIWLGQGGTVALDTYFNLFSLSKWIRACDLQTLLFELSGSGRIELRVVQAISERSWELLFCDIITLEPGSPQVVDLTDLIIRPAQSLIFVEIRCLDPKGVRITGGRFATRDTPGSAEGILPSLAISITTFKREEQVRETVARLEDFLAGFPYADRIRVQVVDNGDSAGIAASDRVVPFINPNYGGAGGFARGLQEAEKAGFSHVLFMDDDASFDMESIARTYMFLAFSRNPRTAVSGAMINNTHKWAMWENGAWFDGSCHPLYCGTDLRNPARVIEMEHETLKNRPATLYGGWWFFAFAIAEVRHRPFPFFVRGDDISFSLMNDFDITTLNGVVSFQDDFSEKESAQTLYLDLRNHIIQHLVTPGLQRSALGTAKVPIRFIMRSLLRFHYESAEAQLLAWEDVMRGPGFFDDNIDMSQRRADIKAMMQTEVWAPVDAAAIHEKKRLTKRSRPRRTRLGIYTLNGHLVPFSRRRWDRIMLTMADRGIVYPAFGAAEITYLNATRDKAYTVTQSKARFFSICWKMLKMTLRFRREFDALKDTYRGGYDELTTPGYWERKLA
ncbi:glycosyltransferase [Albibacillus kandeliae]|uniref:glycosyltransferase n=1 Tax=Albibacillus kandeliae TaxID=2174228 RepID=UPI000D6869B7|nr:glycosyltransferase [Albibacillus kandeliae]